ncbi:MAG: HAD family hydrolase [Rhodobacteraceae bacterium]|nr:HAD family hydrolase [Paracoccaceae bacterium]
MAEGLTTIGFDADDTLWHNERLFRRTGAHLGELLAGHAPSDHVARCLLAAERRNLARYGFGVKGFVLSMIETAIEVTDGRVPAGVIAELLAAGRDMLAEPVELMPHARATLSGLAGRYRLVLLTKGDLIDQERKLERSGIGDFFAAVEIVADKTPATYATVFARHGEGAERAAMVGNSLRSDVLPAIAAGGWGIHVPQGEEWALEAADPPAAHPRFRRLPDLDALPDLLGWIDGA